ncbi:MAG: hypothetical protein LBL98_07990 [Ruminococcus sp.]|jgi:hypothetical protein|nr:hypothetical protein [Ruminococcus sp.]
MKKEELIKKAAERGFALSELQAEKLTELTDEELENLDISGGGCGSGMANAIAPYPGKIVDLTAYLTCGLYEPKDDQPRQPSESNCKHHKLVFKKGHTADILHCCTCQPYYS